LKKLLSLNKNLSLLASLIFFTSCDFTSGLHKSILKAQDYIKEQEYAKAAEEYEDILRAKSTVNLKIKIHYQVGEIYSIYLNKNDSALKNYEQVIELTDNPIWQVKSLEKIASINFEYTKNYKKALSAYKTLKDFTPTLEKQDLYSFRHAQTYKNLSQYDDAIDAFMEIKKDIQHQYYVDSFHEIGLCYFYKKDWKKAIKYWKDFLVRSKEREKIISTKFLMANAYETNEELKKAYNIYYSILNDYPNPSVIKNRLESLYARRVARKR
jgi:tetratricopeptide (TPR) repeat protein